MNLHICTEGNFIQQAMDVFEHFFVGENVFVIFDSHENRDYKGNMLIYRYKRTDPNILKKIEELCVKYSINNIISHGIAHNFCLIFQHLRDMKLYSGHVYWIFWGYELYNALGETGKYRLTDDNSPFSKLTYLVPNPLNAIVKKVLGKELYSEMLEKTLPYLDYFCFWFPYDFELLQKYYISHLKYKYFKYLSNYKSDTRIVNIEVRPKNIGRIMVNHQASLTGNHRTLFQKLVNLSGIDKFEICTPLSYGSRYIRKEVLKMGRRYFGNRYNPIIKLMPLEEYNEFLDSIPVAIFGAMRQEAAGNIMRLLKSGTKIYLREKNPLYQYYKEKGFLVFSFERELNDILDLQPLTEEEQLYNMQVAERIQVYYEDFMPSFYD